MRTILRNDFHNTDAATKYSPEELNRIAQTHPSDWSAAEWALVRRLHDKLCGSPDCSCGDVFGRRGPQDMGGK